ncbi:hypothetical protein [Bradyrhizobium sp. WSM2793]|uniref:hypothetical protein n=1 Tax=Bradyrhizobium sp. WSM2793 TaxID=1038866 RepID=UPI0012FB994F|nr:hypothetical protein [Bradyrhizobium sp. WSM2793]
MDALRRAILASKPTKTSAGRKRPANRFNARNGEHHPKPTKKETNPMKSNATSWYVVNVTEKGKSAFRVVRLRIVGASLASSMAAPRPSSNIKATAARRS